MAYIGIPLVLQRIYLITSSVKGLLAIHDLMTNNVLRHSDTYQLILELEY